MPARTSAKATLRATLPTRQVVTEDRPHPPVELVRLLRRARPGCPRRRAISVSFAARRHRCATVTHGHSRSPDLRAVLLQARGSTNGQDGLLGATFSARLGNTAATSIKAATRSTWARTSRGRPGRATPRPRPKVVHRRALAGPLQLHPVKMRTLKGSTIRGQRQPAHGDPGQRSTGTRRSATGTSGHRRRTKPQLSRPMAVPTSGGGERRSRIRVSPPGCREPLPGSCPRGVAHRGRASPAVEPGAVAASCGHRRSCRPCHPRAISSSHERYAAVNHGHSRRPLRWAPAP